MHRNLGIPTNKKNIKRFPKKPKAKLRRHKITENLHEGVRAQNHLKCCASASDSVYTT